MKTTRWLPVEAIFKFTSTNRVIIFLDILLCSVYYTELYPFLTEVNLSVSLIPFIYFYFLVDWWWWRGGWGRRLRWYWPSWNLRDTFERKRIPDLRWAHWMGFTQRHEGRWRHEWQAIEGYPQNCWWVVVFKHCNSLTDWLTDYTLIFYLFRTQSSSISLCIYLYLHLTFVITFLFLSTTIAI